MFDRLAKLAPSAELSDIRRTLDPAEQRAWADLRAGRSDRAMAHYHSRGQLHMADTRDEAVEQAVQSWAALTETHDPSEVALISDASNQEIHRLNARAQHFRSQRGELGELEVQVPGVEGHDSDRIKRLAQNMRRSHAQTPSLAHPEMADRDYGSHFHCSIAPSRTSRIPGIVRTINRMLNARCAPRGVGRRVAVALLAANDPSRTLVSLLVMMGKESVWIPRRV
jgi:hypothetical protein